MGSGASALSSDAPEDGDPLHKRFVEYDDWLQKYELVKDYSMFGEAIEFCSNNPGTVNNRKGEQGMTLLFQVAYWGADRGVLDKFKALGADPSLKDWQGRTPEMYAQEKGKTDTVAAFREVFGTWEDFEEQKRIVLMAAKAGNLVKLFDKLRAHPHLIHVQSHTGWGILHHLSVQGVKPVVFKRLMAMGACHALRTSSGMTFLHVLADPEHGGSPARRQAVVDMASELSAGANLTCGATVRVVESGKTWHGTITATTEEGITVKDSSGDTSQHPAWRVLLLPKELGTLDMSEIEKSTCMCCYSEPVFGDWVLGAACTGPKHAMCGDCTLTWAWSQWTSGALPITCSMCQQPCDLEKIPPGTERSMSACWVGIAPSLNTTLTYDEFMTRLKERNAEALDPKTAIRNTIQILRECGTLDHPVAYVDVSGTPAARACPSCYVPVYHVDACKHVTCGQCHSSFCWLCAKLQANCPEWSHSRRCVTTFTSAAAQIAELEALL
eukprot:TRINITY_DN108854_c0_g1_i1.p1 TRINITY_DN108854_c0_g1~~TRINITY_DN108854_c0_g1_i1.p1  ORF type:complete len:497 (-),score=69.40 TRINITY_DN108854_c0_g1_i1:537-2027(-)